MRAKRTPPSFSVTLPVEVADQVRAAVQATGVKEGYASVNDLLEAAINKELRRLQRKHNAGKPWPGIPSGVLRPGMRTKSEKNSTMKDKWAVRPGLSNE